MSDPRQPIFELDILTNSDNVSDWLTRTNQIINSLNSFYLADVYQGNGINLTRSEDIVTIDIDPGPGIGFTASKAITLDFNNLTTLTAGSPTISPVSSTDHVIVSKSNTLFKVQASNLLPTTINFEHTFTKQITFSDTLNTVGIALQDSDSLVSGAEITFTHNNSYGYPSGINLKTNVVDSGINVSPDAFIRNYYPEYITVTDNPELANTDFIGEGNTSEDTFFTTANFNFATTTYPDLGDPNLVDGALRQNTVALNFYTGTEGNDGGIPFVGNPNNLGTSSLRWPVKWSMKFNDSSYVLSIVEGYRGGSGTSSYNALSYTYNENPNLSVFNVNGKIFIENLTGSTQFVSAPSGINKVPLTNSSGLLNKKFINRISTSNYTSLSVGDIVYAGTLTDGVVWYEKAQAIGSGNYDTIGIVESIEAGGNAIIVLNGEFELSVSNLEPGTKYYLSQSAAGQYVEEGTYTTGILKPVFVAISESKGILIDAVVDVSSIGNVSVFNISDSSSDSLEIDSPNYDLNLVGGQNIRLEINSSNEIEINVDGLSGAQNTFKSIQVDGVGSTDGDHFVIAEDPDDNVKFISNTLKIIANDTTKEILFEAPNSFTNFKFTDETSNLIYSAETQYDTLQFIAGSGISFTQNTDDSIIISASIEGGVNPDNLIFNGPFQIIVSDNAGQGELVSLEGGDGEQWPGNDNPGGISYSQINVPLDPNKVITDGESPGSNAVFSYDGEDYLLAPQFDAQKYVPDELAGYMIGRITPPLSGSLTTRPDNKIRRLSRRDVRTFLGIATDGFIDEITNVFNSWTLYGDPNDLSASTGNATADSKDGSLVLQAGNGIFIEETGAGPKRILITNTGVPQNAYSSVVIKTYNDTIIDTYDANTSSDSFTLKSGKFVKISTDTDAETAMFDIDIEDDYVILGNPGTSDGMNVISLQNQPFSLVGRAGGSIEAITADTLEWSGNSSFNTAPTLPLPYFGAVIAGDKLLNANNTGTKGKLTFVQGDFITIESDDVNNTITINASGQGEAIDRLTTIFVEDSDSGSTAFSLGVKSGSGYNKLKFLENSFIKLTGAAAGDNTINLTIGINEVSANTILANASNVSAVPDGLTMNANTVLARFASGTNLQAKKLVGSNGDALPSVSTDFSSQLKIPRIARTAVRSAGNLSNIAQTWTLVETGPGGASPMIPVSEYNVATNQAYNAAQGSTVAFDSGDNWNNNFPGFNSFTTGIGFDFFAGTNIVLSQYKSTSGNITSSTLFEAPGLGIRIDALTRLFTDLTPTFYGKHLEPGTDVVDTVNPANKPVPYIITHGSTHAPVALLNSSPSGTPPKKVNLNPLDDNGTGVHSFFKNNKTGIAEYITLSHNASVGGSLTKSKFLYKEIHFAASSASSIVLSDIGANKDATSSGSKAFELVGNIYAGQTGSPGLVEYIYARNYKTIFWDSIADSDNSKWTIEVKDLILDSTDIALGTSGTLNLSNKKITCSNNILPLNTSSGSVMHIVAFNGLTVDPENTTNHDAELHLHSTAFTISLSGNVNSNSQWLKIGKSGANDKIITTNSGSKIIFDTNIDFGTNGTVRTIDFTNCIVNNLSMSAHASTHQWANTEASNGSPPGTDSIQAWQTGAVARNKPTLRNTIYITNADGNFDINPNFDNTGIYQPRLFDGTTTFDSGNYNSSITSTQRGPLYIVVPAGTDPTTGAGAGVAGPPGQIIFVKAS